MLISQMGIEIHFQNSILRKTKNVHILNLGLTNIECRSKYVQISKKIGVYAYLSSGYLNALSKLNSEKVDKSASFKTWFDQPWKRAKIAPNIIKNRCPCLSLKWVPKSTSKTQFQESRQKCIFSTLFWTILNEDQNSSKSQKKGVHSYLSNAYLNLI